MIWIVGNKGMLGSDVEAVLGDAGYDLLLSDSEVDITDYNSLKSFSVDKDISFIVNCAAYTAVDKAEDEENNAFNINATGAGNLAKIASEKKSKLIHFSTDYVFDGSKEGSYLEDDSVNPQTAYGRTKLEGERLIQKTLDNYFILRISWLYGRNGNNFVKTMLRLFSERDELKVVNDQFGSPTYTLDVAEAIQKIIHDDSDRYGVYHFSNEGRITWYDFACEIYRLATEYGIVNNDVNIKSVASDEYPTKAKRPVNSYMSKDKITEYPGVEINDWRISIQEYLEISEVMVKI